MTGITEADVETLLAKGVRNRWYIIGPSAIVADTPISLKRCGYKMALWRGADGKVHALEDHCPHRGAPLSVGIPMGDRIACGYHGVQVDSQGVAVKVPGSPGCKLEGLKATKSFPIEERHGMIFAWIGDALHENPAPLRLPVELESDEYSNFPCYVEWKSPYSYVIDNVMDPMHGTYLHKQSHSMGFGETKAEFRVVPTENGLLFEKAGQRGVNFDWVEFCDTDAHWMRLEIPYPKTGGPGGGFQIVSMVTPIDDHNSAAVFWRCRKVSGWERDSWRFLYKNRLEARHWHVLEQDRAMAEVMEPDANQREMLYQHDMGLVRIRRMLAAEARAQLDALAEQPRKVA